MDISCSAKQMPMPRPYASIKSGGRQQAPIRAVGIAIGMTSSRRSVPKHAVLVDNLRNNVSIQPPSRRPLTNRTSFTIANAQGNYDQHGRYISAEKNYTYYMQQACGAGGDWIPYTPQDGHNEALEYVSSIRDASLVPGLVAMEVTLEDHIVLPVGQRKCVVDALIESEDYLVLGSLGKAFTATLVAKLVEEGSLSWDSTMDELFPELFINKPYQDVTVKMLAAHRAGFDNDTRAWDYDFWYPLRLLPNTDARLGFATWAFQTLPKNDPNGEFLYSNINYLLLGAIVDSVAGSWDEAIVDKFFKPLNMDCGFGGAPQRGYRFDEVDNPWPHRAHYFEPFGRSSDEPLARIEWEYQDWQAWGPAGNMYCRAESYAKFLQLHLRGLLQCNGDAEYAQGLQVDYLSCESLRMIHSPLVTDSDDDVYYTPGAWFTDRQGSLLRHGGTNGWNTARTHIDATRGEAYFSYTNMGPPEGTDAVVRVVEAMIAGRLELEEDVAPSQPFSLPPYSYSRYTGDYTDAFWTATPTGPSSWATEVYASWSSSLLSYYATDMSASEAITTRIDSSMTMPATSSTPAAVSQNAIESSTAVSAASATVTNGAVRRHDLMSKLSIAGILGLEVLGFLL